MPSGKLLKQLGVERGALVRFSPDGNPLVLLDQRGRGQLVHAPDWSAHRYFSSSRGPIRDLAFSADSTMLATCGGADGRAHISTWNTALLEERSVVTYDGAPAQQIALLPHNLAITVGANDDTLRVWDLARNHLIQKDSDREQAIGSMVVSPDGNQVAVGRLDGSIEIGHIRPSGKIENYGGHHRKG